MFKKNIKNLQLLRDQFRYWLGLKLFDTKISKPVLIQNPQKFVFIRWDAKWGDAIVSSFVFEKIRKTYPNAEITVVTTAQMADLFKTYYQVDSVIEITKRPNYKMLKALAEQLGEIDVLVHMSAVLKMKDLFFFNKTQAKIIAGVDDKVNLINLKLGQKTQGLHYADKFAELLKALFIDLETFQYHVPINEKSQKRVNALLETKLTQPLIVINPYGNGNARKLSSSLTKFIIDEVFTLNEKINIAILQSPDTKKEVANICEDYQKDNLFYDENSTSIFDAIALINNAKIVITVDTAIVHIASGLNKSLLAIYNPDEENYQCWHPRTNKAISFFAEKTVPANISNIDRTALKTSIKDIIETNNLA